MGFSSKRPEHWALMMLCLLLGLIGLPTQAQQPPTKEASSADDVRGEAASGERVGNEAAGEPAAQTEIRKALRGLAAEDDEQESSGDPLLDDVLQMIRRRGSILDGTALDPKLVEPDELAAPTTLALPNTPAAAFRVAESLLRSARLLESLPNQDAGRQQLVRGLRSEASRCLRQALSKSPTVAPTTH